MLVAAFMDTHMLHYNACFDPFMASIGGTQAVLWGSLMAIQREFLVVHLSQLDHFALSHVERTF